MTDLISEARKILEAKWDAEGYCGSCGWHACLYEHDVEDWEIQNALTEEDGWLELCCINKDDDYSSSHRGIRINITRKDKA